MTAYQTYNLETDDGTKARIRVYHSIQFNYWERELTISRKGMARLDSIAPGATWYVAPPTPYRPKAIFVLAK